MDIIALYLKICDYWDETEYTIGQDGFHRQTQLVFFIFLKLSQLKIYRVAQH